VFPIYPFVRFIVRCCPSHETSGVEETI